MIPKYGTGSTISKLCQLYLLNRVCQDDCVISQTWLKQSTAHKATLMYCLYWKITVIQQYITILSHHCSNSHYRPHFVSNKEASHLRLQKPQSWLVLCGCQEEHLCTRQNTKLPLSFLVSLSLSLCFLLFCFLNNKTVWWLGKEMVSHSLPLPVCMFVCLLNRRVDCICHL